MKYVILFMFTINIVLKILIGSSAALMWGLIHSLQIFRYILMVNLDMPKLVDIILRYLAVAVGEIDEIENIMPDVVSTYIIDSSELNTNYTLYPRFEENGNLNANIFRI